MSEETAIKAIDYILKNSYRDEIYVGFYGGEPLLKFDLIKKCVSYALENRGEKKVTFFYDNKWSINDRGKSRILCIHSRI